MMITCDDEEKEKEKYAFFFLLMPEVRSYLFLFV